VTAPARPVLTFPDGSGRVMELLVHLSEGRTLEQVASRWGVQAGTVRVYAERMRRYLGADTNPQAVLLACRAGLLDGRPQHHGDHNGYEAHVRRRDEICDDCRDGERAYRAALKAAKGAAA
jgi:DNA-binding CsgD family transcriptional regulator